MCWHKIYEQESQLDTQAALLEESIERQNKTEEKFVQQQVTIQELHDKLKVHTYTGVCDTHLKQLSLLHEVQLYRVFEESFCLTTIVAVSSMIFFMRGQFRSHTVEVDDCPNGGFTSQFFVPHFNDRRPVEIWGMLEYQ